MTEIFRSESSSNRPVAGPDGRPSAYGVGDDRQHRLLRELPRLGRFIGSRPSDAANLARMAVRVRAEGRHKAYRTIVGTHHKVLTVYMLKIFRLYALVTGQRFAMGMDQSLDYGADVLMDHHSAFSFDRLPDRLRGVHICRDPRDLVISSVFYHQKSAEAWLLEPDLWVKGTYQDHLKSLGSFHEKAVFEMEHEAGRNIEDMLAWKARAGVAEFKYEELVSRDASRVFQQGLAAAGTFSERELALLTALFDLYALNGPLSRSRHMRDPKPEQWRDHFDSALRREFETRFPGAVEQLGYSW